jgi:serine/threonine-protein kinase
MAGKCSTGNETGEASPPTDLTMPPETVGHYTIEHELGRGRNGTVYLARDIRLDRRVALKVLDRSGADAWGEALEEARIASALDHPHICTIYDMGEAETDDRSLPYIAMEYVDGRSLAEALEDGPLGRLVVQRYATQLCEALAYAHERGVVHGDVKASNVLITPDAEAKWVDFGSAVRSRRPEAVSAQADVWKMGILIYQMATGEDPPSAASGSASGALPMPRSIPRDLAAIIERCLDRGAERPYSSARDILEDLRVEANPASGPATRKDPPFLSRPFLLAWLALAALLSLGAVVLLSSYLLRRPPAASPSGSGWRGPHPAVASGGGRQTPQAGNPDVKVWANARSMKYHCPDSPWYERTFAGQYLTQGNAQKAGFSPAYGTPCP